MPQSDPNDQDSVSDIKQLRQFAKRISGDHPIKPISVLSSVAEIAEDHPGEVREEIGALGACFDSYNDKKRMYVTYALAEVAEEYPGDVRRVMDVLYDGLTDTNETVRSNTTVVLKELAKVYPDDVREVIDVLQARLDDDHDTIRTNAAFTLAEVAEEYPEDVRGAVDDLQASLDDDHDTVRSNASFALKKLAEEYPGDVCGAVDVLRDHLDDDYDPVRTNVSYTLAAIAEEYPRNVRGAVDDLQASLDDDHNLVRANSGFTLAKVAEEYPDDVRAAVDALEGCLDDDHDPVRSNVTWAIEEVSKTHPSDVQSAVTELSQVRHDELEHCRSRALTAVGAVAEQYPTAVEPVISDIGNQLTDDAVADQAEKILQTLSKTYPDRVRNTVKTHASDRVTEIIGDNSKQQAERSDRSAESESVRSQSDTNRKVPDNIPGIPTVEVRYDALEKGEPLGSGGNADVYHVTVETETDGMTAALKEPRMNGTLHTEMIDRLLEEAETWQKLDDHQQIVTVVQYGAEPLPWIVMEYMDAGHLGERVGEMDLQQALWTAIGTTKAVRHAHRRGVAHLDLKPENILFREVENAWDVPKVADWGLSKQLLDHSKSVEGMSPHYAAPEQFTDDFGKPDDITDIYQLGAVFYELFTGQPPYQGQPFEVMHQIQHEKPTPPSDIANVPTELDDILLKTLATEKKNRYESVIYFRDDLQNLFATI